MHSTELHNQFCKELSTLAEALRDEKIHLNREAAFCRILSKYEETILIDGEKAIKFLKRAEEIKRIEEQNSQWIEWVNQCPFRIE